MNWEDRLQKAKRTNTKRDALDRGMGFATPSETELPIYLATALEAVKAGGKLEDWDFVAEGVVMLEELLTHLKERR